jgi:large conductance mechanosensitive channel
MLKEFKKFILRGNVVDLAVAVVIGAAFTSVVQAFVRDFLTPLIASIQGNHDFSKYSFLIHGSTFMYGDFLNAFITFLLDAAVVFFLVVQPINKLTMMAARSKTAPDPTERKCPECMAEIPVQATRCQFCAIKVKPLKG